MRLCTSLMRLGLGTRLHKQGHAHARHFEFGQLHRRAHFDFVHNAHEHGVIYAVAFLGSALLLFGAGCTFAYFTISRGLEFLLTVGGDGITNLPSIQSYLSFVTLTLLAFGIAFLFPVIVLFLNFVGLFPSAVMRRWRRGMVVGIAVASAVLTPSQDPFTFMAMALPLYGLYEICILIGRVRERASRRRRAVEPGAQELERLGDDETSYVEDRPSPLEP